MAILMFELWLQNCSLAATVVQTAPEGPGRSSGRWSSVMMVLSLHISLGPRGFLQHNVPLGVNPGSGGPSGLGLAAAHHCYLKVTVTVINTAPDLAFIYETLWLAGCCQATTMRVKLVSQRGHEGPGALHYTCRARCRPRDMWMSAMN